MNLNEQIDFINDIETRFPLDTWEIDGINIWPLIRIDMGMKLSYNKGEPRNSNKKDNSLRKRIEQVQKVIKGHYAQVKASIKDKKNNQNLNKADVAFLSHTTCRSLLNDNWYDIFCGPIQNELLKIQKKFVTFEYAPSIATSK
jgi:hypothetical protein